MTDNRLLKHQLDAAAVDQLCDVIQLVYPEFDSQIFTQKALTGLSQLELKARVNNIVSALIATLPDSFEETAKILIAVSEHWILEENKPQWSSFTAWPLIDYVKVKGLSEPNLAFKVLEKLTPLFTAEFAIRAFLEHDFELTHQHMLAWTSHPNEHVRRLASEGMRPRLPWASHLLQLRNDPSPLWQVLERLISDPSLYVRRSVANNLNDISKDHPEQLLAKCRAWKQQQTPHIDWVLSHGLRTLVKTGYVEVYPLLGFTEHPKIQKVELGLAKQKLRLGETQQLYLSLSSIENTPQHLVIDYRVSYVKAGDKTGYKVFKWKNIALPEKGMLRLEKRHVFQAMTTRRHYPGTHSIAVLVNGKVYAQASFELVL